MSKVPQFYKVGGFVRDTVMGQTPNDCDWVVVGATPEWMIANGYKQVGADFPVFLHPETGEEYALARTERKTGVGYHGFDTRFSPDITLEEDLKRRDLTINAMAMDSQGNIIDPFGGQDDIKNKVLRHVSESFREDPVRVLRLGRFFARMVDWTIHPDTIKLCQEIVKAGELNHLTRERTTQELMKMLESNGKHQKFFTFLAQVEGQSSIWPELNAVYFNSKSTNAKMRFANMVLFMKPEQLMKFGEEHRIAGEYIDYAAVYRKMFACQTTDEIVEFLTHTQAYNNPELVMEVCHDYHNTDIVGVYLSTKDIGFKDLPDKSLKGPAIAAAIMAMRKDKAKA